VSYTAAQLLADEWPCSLERALAILAEAERAELRRGVVVGREECAKLCDTAAAYPGANTDDIQTAEGLAEQIRALP